MRLLPFDYAVRNLARSPTRTAGTFIGAALVVLLLLAAGGFVRGMETSLADSGREDNVIVLGAGSEESLERSEIGQSVADQILASVPGIRHRMGVPYVSPEIHMAMLIRTDRDSEAPQQAVLRGVTSAAFLVHPQVRITEGRAPRDGHDEVMVGELAHTRLGVARESLNVGRTLWFDDRPWNIVGRFAAPGTVKHAEIWLPLQNLLIANKRDTISCVIVTLDSAEFGDVSAFCQQRLDLELAAVRESDYYAELNRFYSPIRAMVWITAALVGLGGVLGGFNTVYGALVSRIRELATLQTLGFSRPAIVINLIQESVLIASAGAVTAAAVALLLLDRLSVRFSMGAFAITIDAFVILTGLGLGILLGALAALPPAWRCLRPPIRDALYSS